MKEKFIENNIEYILAEDGIYYPNLKLPEDNEPRPIGLYGSLRRTYLKDHHIQASARELIFCEIMYA